MFKLSFIPFQKNPFCRFLNDVKGGQCRMFFSKGIFRGGFPDSPTVFISAKSSLTKHFNNSRQASDVQIFIGTSVILSPDTRIQGAMVSGGRKSVEKHLIMLFVTEAVPAGTSVSLSSGSICFHGTTFHCCVSNDSLTNRAQIQRY
jgi:hypothetical protein